MFGAEIIRTEQSGKPRLDMNLCGQMFFIAPVAQNSDVGAPPSSPHQGLDHVGLTVDGIDSVVADLKTKGANFTMEPTTIRPGVRIAFLSGPEGVVIEIVDRNAL
jgi:catechol 2,3-dioxygenase-like lactoylglutathione lyase family enzyme